MLNFAFIQLQLKTTKKEKEEEKEEEKEKWKKIKRKQNRVVKQRIAIKSLKKTQQKKSYFPRCNLQVVGDVSVQSAQFYSLLFFHRVLLYDRHLGHGSSTVFTAPLFTEASYSASEPIP